MCMLLCKQKKIINKSNFYGCSLSLVGVEDFFLRIYKKKTLQIPAPTGVDFSKLTTNFDLSESQFNQVYDKNLQVPENVIPLNDCQDYKQLIAWTKEQVELMQKNEKYKVGSG